MKQKIAFLSVTILVLLSSCVVSKKKYDELAVKKSALEVDKAECIEDRDSLMVLAENLQIDIDELDETVSELVTDTAKLSQLYQELITQYTDLAQESDKDAQNLSAQLHKVGKLMQELEKKDRAMAQDQNKIDRLSADLETREKKMAELEELLVSKDDAVDQLKKTVSDALLSFEEGELTVEMKEGKVYVSLQEQLLFKSGSYAVDSKGEDALKKLATAIKDQKDLTIYVEGHTDDVPYNGSGVIKDNWDLSVKRATSIVRILTSNGMDSKQVIASGRSKYAPAAEGTDDASRRKNRRIEVIIHPDLKELYDAIKAY